MRMQTTAGILSIALVAATAPVVHGLERRPSSGMLVIAHRGTPVYASESSLASYRRAADLGADLLEADLTMSKDGRLVICHDIELSRVTDIKNRPEFASRKSVRTFNGIPFEGYWIDDFTWAELQKLRKWDGQPMITAEELINYGRSRGKGLYLEVKMSDYFKSRGLDSVAATASLLQRTKQTQRSSSVWIQSGNPADLQRLRSVVGNRMVYLTRGVSPEEIGNFPAYRRFADVLGVPTTRARRQLVQQAHAADLAVHVWTLRGSRDAYRKAAAIGADGVITDFPDVGLSVRKRERRGGRPGAVTSRVENGNAVVSWDARPGSWYAVTFNFGDPLLAPTLWVKSNTASYPMADSASVDITVARFDGTRLSDDGFSRAALKSKAYPSASVRTRVRNVRAVVSTDTMTRVVGVAERLKGRKWVPLRGARSWLRGRGDDGTDIRRNFRTDKRGQFYLTVQSREDVLTGYVPERTYMVGVTGTKRLRASSSAWTRTEAGSPPARPGKPRTAGAAHLPSEGVEVTVR